MSTQPEHPVAPTQSGTHDDEHELGFQLPAPARMGAARAIAIVLLVGAAGAGAFFFGWLPRTKASADLQAESKAGAGAIPKVEFIKPKVTSSDRALNLPGGVQALAQTVVYPRASGYVKSWTVDLGAHVAEGDTLVEIDTPDADQELLQARAQLQQAQAAYTQVKANADFSKATLERDEKLAASGVMSQQDLEKQRSQVNVDQAGVGVAAANVQAQSANVERLEQLKAYAKVTAPFAGTVTARNVEKGQLVTAGNASPLYTITQSDPARVLIQVPQDVAAGVQVGAKATVTVRSFAGRTFEGTVSHSAGVLDPATRTMTVEVRVPNEKNELVPGMYALVALRLPTPHKVFEIPATALFNDAQGVRLAVVSADDTIHLVPVTIERDLGATLEISTGLDGTERIVKLAAIDLTEGRAVEAVEPPAPSASAKP